MAKTALVSCRVQPRRVTCSRVPCRFVHVNFVSQVLCPRTGVDILGRDLVADQPAIACELGTCTGSGSVLVPLSVNAAKLSVLRDGSHFPCTKPRCALRAPSCLWCRTGLHSPMRRSMVLSTSAAHMSPAVMLLSWISLPDNSPSVRDVTTTRWLDVSSRNEGAFFDVYVLMIFDGGRFGADCDDNHFDSTFLFRSASILTGSSRFFLWFLFLLLASQTGVSHQCH